MPLSPIIGIDLGTTNSLAAWFAEDGPSLIPNATGAFLTPSAIAINDDKELLVGQAAKDRLVSHPATSTARFKRYMGTEHVVSLGKKTFRPEELSAFVLRSLKADAEAHLKQPVSQAVISVPAYFNDLQRKATIAAAQLAGLKVERLINEPTAAALAYGLHHRQDESTFLVVDLGGGTFDVSIVEMFSGVIEVRASSGDTFLGGEDFTDVLLTLLASDIGRDPDSLTKAEFSRLRALADEAKHKLSASNQAEVRYVLGEEEKQLRISLTRFEEATENLVSRMRAPLQRAMNDANLRSDQLSRIILVGGATRMPVIRSAVTKLFKKFPEHNLDPDHVVALGAAVQAGLASNHQALDDIVMTDVSPFTLGIDTSRHAGPDGQTQTGYFSPIIERNTVIPASRVERFHAMKSGQRQIEIKVFQGEAPRVHDNVFLGTLDVPIPVNMHANEEVDIRFTYDTSGMLEVLATVISNGQQKSFVIEGNPGALSQEEISQRLKELERIKVHPREEAENAGFVARIARGYENALGARRRRLSELLSQFEAVLARQNRKEIANVRQLMGDELDVLEKYDVY
ncbi:MAG: molecular chaperone HscC [Mesorhizobium sp.]